MLAWKELTGSEPTPEERKVIQRYNVAIGKEVVSSWHVVGCVSCYCDGHGVRVIMCFHCRRYGGLMSPWCANQEGLWCWKGPSILRIRSMCATWLEHAHTHHHSQIRHYHKTDSTFGPGGPAVKMLPPELQHESGRYKIARYLS